MEGCALSFWIYMGVMSVFVGGVVKKVLASHISAMPSLVAWLAATVLLERLCTLCLPAFLVLAGLCAACCLYSSRQAPNLAASLPTEGKAVLITGCDSGFGHAAAKRLDALGFEVFATVLNLAGEGAQELQRTCSPRLTLLQVDITKPADVQQALIHTKAKLGMKGLWALVNNAGLCVNFGDAELSLISNYRGCMEVNFFGTLSVTKAFLPLLRQAKGRIVTISSPSGDLPFPCLAAYGASKAALNLFISTLRHELEPWGVKVTTIQPGAFRTGLSANTEHWEKQHKVLLENISPSLLEEYGEDYIQETRELFASHAVSAPTDVSHVINTIVEALVSPQPQVRYFAGPGVGLMYFIHSYLPVTLSDKFLQKLFIKKQIQPRLLRKQNNLGKIHCQNNNNNNNISSLNNNNIITPEK
ncbi:11-beta-hydroxysteroid dehydrogenase type 2 [Sardina pilchardus]|uniref:11-beta-hydroxysteroid dehydrogenase type 2 n=1 Tax=Sardina pilchardus TaxID=27697 RepID=UPI002E0F4ADE